MRITIRTLILGVAVLCAIPAHAADAPALLNAKDLKWVDVTDPAGAKLAALWGDPKSNDSGVLVRWKFNSKVRDLVRTQDVHFLVLAGTFTVEIGSDYKEFGPSGFVSIPKGVKHTIGCEASGECKFLMHHEGAVEVTKAAAAKN